MPMGETIQETKRRLRAMETVKFGKWATNMRDHPLRGPVCGALRVHAQEDVEHLRNTLAQGNYPLGMSDCEVVGINGDCGENCPVRLAGRCSEC